MERWNWPTYQRPGIRYGNLNPDQLAKLSPFFQSRLSDRVGQGSNALIEDAGNPELKPFVDPILPPEPGVQTEAAHTFEPMRYGSFINQQLSIGVVDTVVLAIPPGGTRRTFLMIVNTHPLQNMFLTFQVAANQNLGIPILNTNGFILLDT